LPASSATAARVRIIKLQNFYLDLKKLSSQDMNSSLTK